MPVSAASSSWLGVSSAIGRSVASSALAARAFGTDVILQVVIDPAVLGGVSVRVGDEIVDGTVLRRLAEAKRQLRR